VGGVLKGVVALCPCVSWGAPGGHGRIGARTEGQGDAGRGGVGARAARSVARWPGGPVARWPGGQVARWPGGRGRGGAAGLGWAVSGPGTARRSGGAGRRAYVRDGQAGERARDGGGGGRGGAHGRALSGGRSQGSTL